jgi:hypothetical protein
MTYFSTENIYLVVITYLENHFYDYFRAHINCCTFFVVKIVNTFLYIGVPDGIFSYPKSLFGYILQGLGIENLGIFMSVWNILWPFGILFWQFCSQLVYIFKIPWFGYIITWKIWLLWFFLVNIFKSTTLTPGFRRGSERFSVRGGVIVCALRSLSEDHGVEMAGLADQFLQRSPDGGST